MQPKLLLLDEPTAQLDPIAAKEFLGLLKRINEELGITIVFKWTSFRWSNTACNARYLYE